VALGRVFDEAEDLHGLSEPHLVAQEATGRRRRLALQHPANGGHLVRFVGEALPERLRVCLWLKPHGRAGAGHSATRSVVHLGLATNPFYTVTVTYSIRIAGAEDGLPLLLRSNDRRRRRARALRNNKLVKLRRHVSGLLEGF